MAEQLLAWGSSEEPAAGVVSVDVVVPVRDEEGYLPRCLEHLDGAQRRLATTHPEVASRIVLVLDTCTDATGAIAERAAAANASIKIIVCRGGSVGAARDLGIRWALAQPKPGGGAIRALPQRPGPNDVGPVRWIANTDADTFVPENWLQFQVDHASGGLEVILGTVQPDPAEIGSQASLRWHAEHSSSDGHRHIHGANMGFRDSIYQAAGGFSPQDAVHEDVHLVGRMKALRAQVLATGGINAITSGRRHGRVQGGFADYLGSLDSSGGPRPAGRCDRPSSA